MEQIRIVKEMRNATNGNQPRFMVWENVPGAFSSNKGKDFAAVLEETIRVVEPEAPVLMCLNADGRHGDSTATWEYDGVWRGECLTRNTGESPNAVVASRLSQILEEAPQEKYFLTARACQGILNRAKRRGKELPPQLKAALEIQSGACKATESTAPIPQDVTDADGGRTKATR
jgi:hypothetical protein